MNRKRGAICSARIGSRVRSEQARMEQAKHDTSAKACDCYWHRTGRYDDSQWMCGEARMEQDTGGDAMDNMLGIRAALMDIASLDDNDAALFAKKLAKAALKDHFNAAGEKRE